MPPGSFLKVHLLDTVLFYNKTLTYFYIQFKSTFQGAQTTQKIATSFEAVQACMLKAKDKEQKTRSGSPTQFYSVCFFTSDGIFEPSEATLDNALASM